MDNQQLINSQGRQLFFFDVWQRCQDVFTELPAGTGRLRLVVETDAGRRLLVVPMETADAPFLDTVIQGVANMAEAKSSAAVVKKQLTDLP